MEITPTAKVLAEIEMLEKWGDAGETLTNEECAYLTAQNVDPGFNDHSSRSVLEAYRAGRAAGTSWGHCCGLTDDDE